MEEKYLGKITNVKFGIGGYQDAMFGISFTFGFDGSGIGDFKGFWDPSSMPRSEYAKWTEDDRNKSLAELCRFISKTMSDAKVDDVNDLNGIPVEVTIENHTLKSWRILTEVL